jgi:hypothetical protein
MARAFIIRPFGPKQDSAGKPIDFERVHRELIEPALTAVGCGGGTTGQIVEAGNIREDMFALIIEADLVVCDIPVHNANVFYELGIRHALRKKRTVLLKGEPTQDGTPFDVLTDRYLAYDIDNPSAAKDALIETIKATLASERETDGTSGPKPWHWRAETEKRCGGVILITRTPSTNAGPEPRTEPAWRSTNPTGKPSGRI